MADQSMKKPSIAELKNDIEKRDTTLDDEKKVVDLRKTIAKLKSLERGDTEQTLYEEAFDPTKTMNFATIEGLRDKGVDDYKIERMKPARTINSCLIYPEDYYKSTWDLFITIMLVVTCI